MGRRQLVVGWVELFRPSLFSRAASGTAAGDSYDDFLRSIDAWRGIFLLRWEAAAIRSLWLLIASSRRGAEWTVPAARGAMPLSSVFTKAGAASVRLGASLVCGLQAPDHDAVAAKGQESMKSKSIANACSDASARDAGWSAHRERAREFVGRPEVQHWWHPFKHPS